MRNYGATHNLTAISAGTGEAAINVFAPVDLSILCDMGDVAKLSPRREDNSDEANGKEEADLIYDNGATSEASFNHNRAQPQHFAYLYAFALGDVTTVAAGAGYEHTIKPITAGVDPDRELPSLSMLTRLGSSVLKRRLASMFVDSVSATFNADDWVKVSGSLKGTGKYEDNVVSEVVSAPGDSVSFSVSQSVQGSSATERLDSIHRVQAELSPGVWTDVVATAVSDADPAVLSITGAGGTSTNIDFKVLYVPVESADFTFPGRVVESPLRVAEMSFNLGGSWNGTAFVGGRSLGSEIRSISCQLNNNSKIQFVPGGGGAFASMHERGGRSQSLKVDRSFRDYILQQHVRDNDTFGAYIKCEGAEFSSGHRYQVEIIFPKLGVMSAGISVADKKLAEAGDFAVLEDDIHGSIIVRVKNLFDGYAK